MAIVKHYGFQSHGVFSTEGPFGTDLPRNLWRADFHRIDVLFNGQQGRRPADVGLAPTALWRVPSPIPPLQLEDPFLTTALPSPPSPFSSPQPPLALFAMLREGTAQAGVGGGPYMREIGAMWQIGVLAGKPCTFLVQNGSFSAFWHYKNKERLSRGLGVKWHILSTCLDVAKKCFSIGIYSINRASEWL